MANKKVKPIPKENIRQNNKGTAPKQDLLDIIDVFLAKRSKLFLYIFLGLSVLFSILLFDVKVGIGGDDSTYILRAYDFIHDGTYPSYQGPLYPMILSPFIGIFGIHLPMLKLLSLIFTVLAIILTYKAFLNTIPKTVLFPSLLLVSMNYFVLYFASQTYSEAFFFFLQSLLIWFFLKYFIAETKNPSYKNFIILGLLLFLLGITRNIGLVAIVAVIAYFILRQQWKNALLILLSFAIFFLGFEILKRIIWKTTDFQISSQGSSLMYKNFYDASKGTEDLAGFIKRLVGNSNLYFETCVFLFGITERNYRNFTFPDFGYLVFIICIIFQSFKEKSSVIVCFNLRNRDQRSYISRNADIMGSMAPHHQYIPADSTGNIRRPLLFFQIKIFELPTIRYSVTCHCIVFYHFRPYNFACKNPERNSCQKP
jgi:hypothetical protein